jgi:hypothetical protein
VDPDDDDEVVEELDSDYEIVPELRRVIDISRGLSHWIQLDTPGFLVNSRQHKMFGIAALQMAKRLSQHCDLIIIQCDEELFSAANGNGRPDMTCTSGRGLQVPNLGASGCSIEDSGIDEGRSHFFMFRDFFDIVVKWRQVSEPNDPVWWIDR